MCLSIIIRHNARKGKSHMSLPYKNRDLIVFTLFFFVMSFYTRLTQIVISFFCFLWLSHFIAFILSRIFMFPNVLYIQSCRLIHKKTIILIRLISKLDLKQKGRICFFCLLYTCLTFYIIVTYIYLLH